MTKNSLIHSFICILLSLWSIVANSAELNVGSGRIWKGGVIEYEYYVIHDYRRIEAKILNNLPSINFAGLISFFKINKVKCIFC